MKIGRKLVGLALLMVLVVSGCQSKKVDHHAAQRANRPQPSKLTTLLKAVKGNTAEDTGTRTNHEITYSRFYYHQNHWRWALTTKKATIVKGIVTQVNKQGAAHKLTVKQANGQRMHLTLSWLDGALQSYNLKSSQPQLNRNFILKDDGSAWTAGVPVELKGTWQTGLYDAKRLKSDGKLTPQSVAGSPESPLVETTFYINDNGLDGVNNSYNKHDKLTSEGAGWGVNSHVSYKKLAHGDYLLKSYWGGRKVALDVYRVRLTGKHLKLVDALGNIPSMTRLSSDQAKKTNAQEQSATTADQAQQTSSSERVDTNNLSVAQVNNWIWLHMVRDDFKGDTRGFTQSDYMFQQTMNDEGNLEIEVRENHSTKHMRDAGMAQSVDPRYGSYEINDKGELMKETLNGGYRVIAKEYGQ